MMPPPTRRYAAASLGALRSHRRKDMFWKVNGEYVEAGSEPRFRQLGTAGCQVKKMRLARGEITDH